MRATLIAFFVFISCSLFSQSKDSTLLYLQIIPGQCEMKIDGIKMVNNGKVMLSPGTHRIVLWKMGFHLFDTTFQVTNTQPIILKKRLAIRDDYRTFEKESNKYQFKRMLLNRGTPIAGGIFIGVSAYSMLASRQNVRNGDKFHDQYEKSMSAEDVIFYKGKYEEEREQQKQNIRNAVIFGSAGAVLCAATFCFYKKVQSKRPVYVDPGALQFDSAWLNYRTGGLMCSINFKIN